MERGLISSSRVWGTVHYAVLAEGLQEDIGRSLHDATILQACTGDLPYFLPMDVVRLPARRREKPPLL